MQINQATDYGFRAALYLAGSSSGDLVEAQTIARQESIPMRYLLKIMPSLIRAGLVRSQRGVGGGYALARSPSDITLLEIIEAIEGPIRLNRCLVDPAWCSKAGPPHCKIHQALGTIQLHLSHDLNRYTLAQLLD